MKIFTNLSELKAAIGQEFSSATVPITQELIDQFGKITRDEQWIHSDPERAARETPFGGAIAQGYLTLSHTSYFIAEALTVSSVKFALNYGLDKVRFLSPVPAGARIRAQVHVMSVEPQDGGQRVKFGVTVYQEGQDKPVCYAEKIALMFE